MSLHTDIQDIFKKKAKEIESFPNVSTVKIMNFTEQGTRIYHISIRYINKNNETRYKQLGYQVRKERTEEEVKQIKTGLTHTFDRLIKEIEKC